MLTDEQRSGSCAACLILCGDLSHCGQAQLAAVVGAAGEQEAVAGQRRAVAVTCGQLLHRQRPQRVDDRWRAPHRRVAQPQLTLLVPAPGVDLADRTAVLQRRCGENSSLRDMAPAIGLPDETAMFYRDGVVTTQ